MNLAQNFACAKGKKKEKDVEHLFILSVTNAKLYYHMGQNIHSQVTGMFLGNFEHVVALNRNVTQVTGVLQHKGCESGQTEFKGQICQFLDITLNQGKLCNVYGLPVPHPKIEKIHSIFLVAWHKVFNGVGAFKVLSTMDDKKFNMYYVVNYNSDHHCGRTLRVLHMVFGLSKLTVVVIRLQNDNASIHFLLYVSSEYAVLGTILEVI